MQISRNSADRRQTWARKPLFEQLDVKDMQTRFSLKEVKADGAWPLGQLERR
jgi:hypothetical protein